MKRWIRTVRVGGEYSYELYAEGRLQLEVVGRDTSKDITNEISQKWKDYNLSLTDFMVENGLNRREKYIEKLINSLDYCDDIVMVFCGERYYSILKHELELIINGDFEGFDDDFIKKHNIFTVSGILNVEYLAKKVQIMRKDHFEVKAIES